MTDESESEAASDGPETPSTPGERTGGRGVENEDRIDGAGQSEGGGRSDGARQGGDGGDDSDGGDGGDDSDDGDGGVGSDGGDDSDDRALGRTQSGADGGYGPSESLGDVGTEDPSQIDPSELTVARRSLNPRIRIVWVARAVLTALIAGGLAYVADDFVLEVGLVVPAGVTVGLLILGVAHALLRYRVWSYEVREDALYLERGVVTRVRTVVPFVRIQHVDTSRGPIERASGLATSVVYTAGSRGADVAIPGLEADRADDLQQRLKRLAIASEADTAV